MRIRCSDPGYMTAVESWWGKLLPMVRPYLSKTGGPIVAMQLENEYGYWGYDPAYLEALRSLALGAFGEDCPLLFTSDGTFWPDLQANGGLDGVLRTANFGSDPGKRLQELRAAQPQGPLCNMEFWVGWFDAWGSPIGKSYRAAADVAGTLRETLMAQASVNIFVFHGGTSFGLCGAGANLSPTGQYEPQVTSYDYGGLLDEAGDVTEKYLRCREVIAEVLGEPKLLERTFPKAPRLRSAVLSLEASLSLADALPFVAGPAVSSSLPLPAEDIGIGHGYVLYRAKVPPGNLPLQVKPSAVRDYASIMLDGQVLGTMYRNFTGPDSREFAVQAGGRLEILVELMGRINFGPAMLGERKGLVGGGSVMLGSPSTGPVRSLFGWEALPLPMADLSGLPWAQGFCSQEKTRGPRFFRYFLYVLEPADGFLALEGFRKGFAVVNGFNLGRYWEVGPQQTLYIPAPLLRRGQNEVIVFDIDHPEGLGASARVVPEAIWTSGVLPQGAKEAFTDAALGFAQAVSQLSKSST